MSICHCLACQRRTGSAFGLQARFARADTNATGPSSRYERAGDSGGVSVFHFCAVCGTTLYWEPRALAGFVVVAVGAFADPAFPPPTISVYEERRHRWLPLPAAIEHLE